MIRIASAFALGFVLAAGAASAEERKAPPVPSALRDAVASYLAAPDAKEADPLRKAVAAAKGDVLAAAEALRAHAPLTAAKPGTAHGLTFTSGTQTFEYSILLPRTYDGKRRHAVLVLPDHGAVDAESGIGFWAGKDGAEDLIVFRPVLVKHQEDASRFPQGADRDHAIAAAMADALRHLRLHYAVDHDRLFATGLSQAGYYAWWYGVTMPDQFAALLPESAGGPVVTQRIEPLARNAAHVAVRILHTEGDAITPYANAVRMRDAIRAAGGAPELVTYTDADYDGNPFPKRHPGPHHLRLRNVLDWGPAQKRAIPETFTRVLSSPVQGTEGRFAFPPPKAGAKPVTVECSETGGVLSAKGAAGARYRVAPQDAAAGREFTVGSRKVAPKPDIELLIRDFKSHGDPSRMCAAEIDL